MVETFFQPNRHHFTMLYFTYGSFMDANNLKKHTPSAKLVCKALIPNWEVEHLG